jgi:hypothetical protein
MTSLVQLAGSSAPAPIRVFPRRTEWTPRDPMAFVGFPPLFRPPDPETPVYVSVTFTWDKAHAERIADSWRQHYRNVFLGGPAYDDPGGQFTPGMFLKEGCTITSRGCPKKCGWCKVPFSEGNLRELVISPGYILQDNNILACSENHIRAVFDMLRQQGRRAYFNGGLDKHFLQPWHRELFDSIPMRKLRCYVMIGYDSETATEAAQRLEHVFSLGFMPFCQLYQPPTDPMPTRVYSAEWKAIMRKWARPAAYMPKAS